MNLFAMLPFVASLLLLGLGVFIFAEGLRVYKAYYKVAFAVGCICCFIWLFSFSMMYMTNERCIALFCAKLGVSGAIFTAMTFHHFVVLLLNRRERALVIFTYILGTIFTAFLWVPNILIRGLYEYEWGYYPNFSALNLLSILLFAALFVRGAWLSYFGYRQKQAQNLLQESNRIKYIFLGFVIGPLAGMDYLPAHGIEIYPLGFLIMSFWVGIISYAIIKYRLMDMRIVITRTVIFVFVYGIVLLIPFLLGYLAKDFLITILQDHWWISPLVAMAIFATAGPFTYSYLQRKAENRLRREEFQAHEALNRLAQNMMHFTNLKILLKLIVHYVVKIMKVNFASVYLRDEENRHYHLRAIWSVNNTSPEQGVFLEDSSLLKDILLRRVPIVSEEIKLGHSSKISSHLKRVQSELQKSKSAVIIPAFKGDDLFGFLMLGERRDNRVFSQDDLNLLMLLANQSVLAIENAQLFEKEKTLLAEKSRRGALADLAPGVSHQFNNRLMAISVTAEADLALLEQKPFKDLTREELKALFENSKAASKKIMQEALKGKDIADAIMKKGKAKITFTKTDLAPVIQSAIELLKLSRTKVSLEGAKEPEIILDVDKDLPQLTFSESLMQDIFYNLIDNARDAAIMKDKAIREDRISPDETPYTGEITISVYKKDDKVVVSVNDNGIGIKKENLKKVFVPYFTTKATAFKGTGMGLWAVRGFIEDHKGRIWVESEHTKGTTFTIEFPINKGTQ